MRFSRHLRPGSTGAACVEVRRVRFSREVKRRHATDPKTTQQSSFHFRWIMGTEDIDTAIERAGRFSLAGVAQKIACPFLIYREKNPASIFIDAGFGAGLFATANAGN